INFSFLYTYDDGDVVDVRLNFYMTNVTIGISVGGIYHAMNFDPAINSSLGVTYWYLMSFDTPGNYTYTFNVTDAQANESVVENGTGFNVILQVPDEGKLYGWVMTGLGNNSLPVPEADLIIHYYDNNTNITNYYNTTTNVTGYYSKTLPIVEEPYFVTVNATGFFDSEKFKFQLLTIYNNVKKNFTLEPWEPEIPPDTTGELEGYILSTNGDRVANASIIVVSYTDTALEDNITGNITNETVREYNNLTASSNSTGYYLLIGIPTGNWTVVASAAGYVDTPGELKFTTELLTVNFTIVPIKIYYKITGTVLPTTASVKIGLSQITVNAISGNFTIDSLIDADYTLTFSADGYATIALNVIVNGSDVELGIISLNKLVNIGPIMDGEDKIVAGANVSFTVEGIEHTAETDSLGIAVFELSDSVNIISGTKITAVKNGTSITWSHGEEIPIFGGVSSGAEGELTTGMILVTIVVAVILILIVVIQIFKKD
ncbi:MAG: carboxypeptidase-like regulatory domain-containing protein, partial [Candidatus Thermoplasmatota archaeon]|nr:carboxypeptidase-like regulatory domain-containing protein [Candidatus Thermoplasmatota archaeon]